MNKKVICKIKTIFMAIVLLFTMSDVTEASIVTKAKTISFLAAEYTGMVLTGKKLDLEHLAVVVGYSDGSSAVVRKNQYLLGDYRIKSGKNKIKLHYKGKSTTFYVRGIDANDCVPYLKNNTIKIYKGKSYSARQNISVSPDQSLLDRADISWKSSNSKIARVSSKGVVKGIKNGNATITINVFDACLKFKVQVCTPATAVVLSNTSLVMFSGRMYDLSCHLEPLSTTDKVKWKSSRPDIVSVSSVGQLKALKSGKAIITAIADSGVSKKCTVTVYRLPSKIQFKKNTYKVAKGKKISLSCIIYPQNAYKSLIWDSTNTTIATVNNRGVVYGRKRGTANLIVTTSNGKWASCKIIVY